MKNTMTENIHERLVAKAIVCDQKSLNEGVVGITAAITIAALIAAGYISTKIDQHKKNKTMRDVKSVSNDLLYKDIEKAKFVYYKKGYKELVEEYDKEANEFTKRIQELDEKVFNYYKLKAKELNTKEDVLKLAKESKDKFESEYNKFIKDITVESKYSKMYKTVNAADWVEADESMKRFISESIEMQYMYSGFGINAQRRTEDEIYIETDDAIKDSEYFKEGVKTYKEDIPLSMYWFIDKVKDYFSDYKEDYLKLAKVQFSGKSISE